MSNQIALFEALKLAKAEEKVAYEEANRLEAELGAATHRYSDARAQVSKMLRAIEESALET